MYVKDCGYGRSRRCKRRIWSIVGICIISMGVCGVTFRVGTRQNVASGNVAVLHVEAAEAVENLQTMEATAEMTTETAVLESTMIVESVPEPDEGILIVIDPGHGGVDEGCSREGIWEKDINLQLSLLLKEQLEQKEYQVLLTRESDMVLSLEERVELANNAKADLYISIHQNACEAMESDVSGIETFYSEEQGTNGKRLAQLVHSNVILYTDKRDRGIHSKENLYVIRETDMPSCLIETGFLSNSEDRQALTDVEFQEKIVKGMVSGIDLYFYPKTMYLTFDDGPSPKYTETILDILKEKEIKATFFVVGENVRKNPQIAKRIVEEGHTIGIHCNSHDYNALYESVDSYVADFERAYQIVYEVTGVEATLFRFPGGSINAYNKAVYQDMIEEMEEKGFVYFDWNASLEDAVTKAAPEELIRNARESTLGRKKVVMLAHDIVENTSLCLEELIAEFPEYKMEPLTAEVAPIQF